MRILFGYDTGIAIVTTSSHLHIGYLLFFLAIFFSSVYLISVKALHYKQNVFFLLLFVAIKIM